jgi:hypothetical protein
MSWLLMDGCKYTNVRCIQLLGNNYNIRLSIRLVVHFCIVTYNIDRCR